MNTDEAVTPTTPLDAHLALAQRVQELEGMLELGKSFRAGYANGLPVDITRQILKNSSRVWFFDRDPMHGTYYTPELAIRAAREYIKQQGGTLA